MPMAYPLTELRSKSIEDLIQGHDELAKNTGLGISYYLEEIRRRELDEQSQRMLTMTADIRTWTKMMMILTIVITALTAINVWAVLTIAR